MDKFVINGGNELNGQINISGAKNAAVAIIPAAILAQDVVVLENIPNISDVTMFIEILRYIGAEIEWLDENTVRIDSRFAKSTTIPYDMTKCLRASYYLLGAMLGRYKTASVAFPGGCDFGGRPIDQHIKSFEALGAVLPKTYDSNIVHIEAEALYGNSIYMDVVSVGATINAMLSAVTARGLTVIENAAKEPHIVDVANFLNSMGADVRSAGTDNIKVYGVEKLHGCTYSIIPDQIEAGTYMAAIAACGGDVVINNVTPKHLESITKKLSETGAMLEEGDDWVRIRRKDEIKPCNVKTMPHPGFPTDMQPQMSVVLALANGTSTLREDVWDNRFQYIPQLVKMGADVQTMGKRIQITGVDCLTGASVSSTDLRAGAAMVLAGLAAKGETEVLDIEYIDRGYENFVEKLQSLGADIRREKVYEIPDESEIGSIS